MGNIGSCFRSRDSGHSSSKPSNGGGSGPKQIQSTQKDRVTEQDKAILDVKARMRKIKVYIDKINLQVDQQKQKIKEHLANKSKERALVALKHRKFLEKELQKAEGAQQLLQQTITNIESAQMDVQVMEALKVGDKVIQDLQAKASLEDFEELYDRHKEQQQRMEMEQDLFGQVLNEEELQDELDALDAEIADMEIVAPANHIIEQDYSNKQQQQQRAPQQQASPQKRQMVAA